MKLKLQEAMKAAMKSKDKIRLDTIRGLLTAIQYEEIEKKIEPLPEDAILSVIQREVKKRREENDFAEKANRPDLVQNLKLEIAVLEGFLPAQLTAEQIEKFFSDYKSKTPGANMGAAMKAIKDTHAGQYDSKSASDIAKRVFG